MNDMKKKLLLFFILFINVIAGMLVTYGVLPNRTDYLLLLPLCLVLIGPIRWNRYYSLSVIFVLFFFFNAYWNGIGLISAAKYSKYALIPFLAYFTTDISLDKNTANKLLSLLIWIGLVQLPVVVVQNLFVGQLVGYTVVPDMLHEDFTTGTFWLRNDPALNFFLIALISFLLFSSHSLTQTKTRFLISYFTITLLLSNSKLALLILVGIFILFALRDMSIANFFKYLSIATLVVGVLFFFFSEAITIKLQTMYSQMTNVSEGAVKEFLKGGYSRTAALVYLISEPLKVVGDGVGAYVDLDTNEYRWGLRGQIFIFYAEIGIIGLTLSYYLAYAMVKEVAKKMMLFHVVILGSFVLFTYTSRPFADFSILLTILLFSRICTFYDNQTLINQMALKPST